MTLPELYSLAAGDSVLCGPKKVPGTLRHFEDHLCEQARVEMANGKLKRWASSELRPARGPRVPAVRPIDPEDEGGPLPFVSRSVEPADFAPQPKRLTPRDPKFLAHVRTLPCCHCNAPPRSEAAHFGGRGTGIKSSDYECGPLCPGPNGCHAYWHLHGTLPGLTREESMIKQWAGAEAALASFVGPEEAARAIAAWIEEGRRER